MATQDRGFASMDSNKQHDIAAQGGKQAHAKGTAHTFSSDEAHRAGQKGGHATSSDKQHMRQMGKKGGGKH